MADVLGVTPRTFQGYVKSLKIPHYNLGRYPRFDRKEVLEHIAVEFKEAHPKVRPTRRAASARGEGRFAGLLD
jgi:excisionase family DNA binding protein